VLAFLVGVDHELQYLRSDLLDYKGEAVDNLRIHLTDSVHGRQVVLLAEEFSTEACDLNRVSASVAQLVACELGIPHLFCDPTTEERTRHGITSHDDRECFWLERLLTVKPTRLLFACGDSHLETFGDKLRSAGYEVEILSRGWKV
jgi:hypothetical protein